MKARYCVTKQMEGWAVLDRLAIEHVIMFRHRAEARIRARELNTEARRAETKEEVRHVV